MQIDKGIPIPDPLTGKRRGPNIKQKHIDMHRLIRELQIGDSFLVPNRYISGKNCFWMAQTLERRYRINLRQRMTAEGLRVWRTA